MWYNYMQYHCMLGMKWMTTTAHWLRELFHTRIHVHALTHKWTFMSKLVMYVACSWSVTWEECYWAVGLDACLLVELPDSPRWCSAFDQAVAFLLLASLLCPFCHKVSGVVECHAMAFPLARGKDRWLSVRFEQWLDLTTEGIKLSVTVSTVLK